MQLWVATRLQFQERFVDYISHRILLVVGVARNCLLLACVVAHAPIRDASEEEHSDFWEKLWETMARAKHASRGGTCFLMIDANGRVGSHKSHVIGSKATDVEDRNGFRLCVQLEQDDVYASSTFKCSDWTWRASKGKTSTIDYVCSSALPTCCTEAKVLDIDLSLSESADHRPIAAKFEGLCYITEKQLAELP